MSTSYNSCPSKQTPEAVVSQKRLKMSMCAAIPPSTYSAERSAAMSSGIHPDISRAVFLTSTLWPQRSTININFVNGDDWQKAWVEKIVTEELQPYINLDLNFDQAVSPEHITISFDAEGASSLIGKQSVMQKPSMYLGWVDPPDSFEWKGVTYTPSEATYGASGPGIPKGMHRNNGYTTGATVIHEFGHALGMLHEHQNPRGEPIEWNQEAVWNAYCGPPNNWNWDSIQYNVLNPLELDSTNGSIFDPDSIMIYQFSPELTLNMPQGTHMNPVLSKMDKEWLHKMYPSIGYNCVDGRCIKSTEGELGEYETLTDCYNDCGSYVYSFREDNTTHCTECGVTIYVFPDCVNEYDEVVDAIACSDQDLPSSMKVQCQECDSPIDEEPEGPMEVIDRSEPSPIEEEPIPVHVMEEQETNKGIIVILYILILSILIYYFRDDFVRWWKIITS